MVRAGSPAALLTLVPHLLGFVPEASLVVIGVAPPRDRIRVTLRYDLPEPPAVAVLRTQRLTAAVAVAYGPETLVTHGAARTAATAPWPPLPLTLPLRPGQRRSAGAESGDLGAAINRESSRGRGGFDKGTLAAAHIGLTRAGGSQPDPPTSVRAAAPCQIRHSRPRRAAAPSRRLTP